MLVNTSPDRQKIIDVKVCLQVKSGVLTVIYRITKCCAFSKYTKEITEIEGDKYFPLMIVLHTP